MELAGPRCWGWPGPSSQVPLRSPTWAWLAGPAPERWLGPFQPFPIAKPWLPLQPQFGSRLPIGPRPAALSNGWPGRWGGVPLSSRERSVRLSPDPEARLRPAAAGRPLCPRPRPELRQRPLGPRALGDPRPAGLRSALLRVRRALSCVPASPGDAGLSLGKCQRGERRSLRPRPPAAPRVGRRVALDLSPGREWMPGSQGRRFCRLLCNCFINHGVSPVTGLGLLHGKNIYLLRICFLDSLYS